MFFHPKNLKSENNNPGYYCILNHQFFVNLQPNIVQFSGWNGMIENILDQSADLISASLTMSQVRYEVVDYLTPIGMETYSIFIKVVEGLGTV